MPALPGLASHGDGDGLGDIDWQAALAHRVQTPARLAHAKGHARGHVRFDETGRDHVDRDAARHEHRRYAEHASDHAGLEVA